MVERIGASKKNIEPKMPNGHNISESDIRKKNIFCGTVGVPPNMRAVSPLFCWGCALSFISISVPFLCDFVFVLEKSNAAPLFHSQRRSGIGKSNYAVLLYSYTIIVAID